MDTSADGEHAVNDYTLVVLNNLELDTEDIKRADAMNGRVDRDSES